MWDHNEGNIDNLRLKTHRDSRFLLPTSRSMLLGSTDSHHAHNRHSHMCFRTISITFILIIILPSQFTYGQKVSKHTFSIHAWGRKSYGTYLNKIPLTIFQFTREAWSSMELQPKRHSQWIKSKLSFMFETKHEDFNMTRACLVYQVKSLISSISL